MTAVPFNTLVQEKIAIPLGLVETGFIHNREDNRSVIQGHAGELKIPINAQDPTDLGRASGGIIASQNRPLTERRIGTVIGMAVLGNLKIP